MLLNTDALWMVASIGVGVASLALTITRARVSATPRRWVKEQSEFLGELVSCPYCMSHWLSLLAVLIFEPGLCPDAPFAGAMLAMFMSVTIASLLAGLIIRSISSIPADEEEEE